jgi:hypothetical protein
MYYNPNWFIFSIFNASMAQFPHLESARMIAPISGMGRLDGIFQVKHLVQHEQVLRTE